MVGVAVDGSRAVGAAQARCRTPLQAQAGAGAGQVWAPTWTRMWSVCPTEASAAVRSWYSNPWHGVDEHRYALLVDLCVARHRLRQRHVVHAATWWHRGSPAEGHTHTHAVACPSTNAVSDTCTCRAVCLRPRGPGIAHAAATHGCRQHTSAAAVGHWPAPYGRECGWRRGCCLRDAARWAPARGSARQMSC